LHCRSIQEAEKQTEELRDTMSANAATLYIDTNEHQLQWYSFHVGLSWGAPR
jgi:hypothetical protein